MKLFFIWHPVFGTGMEFKQAQKKLYLARSIFLLEKIFTGPVIGYFFKIKILLYL